ncbi:LysR substrate-binding domain-containing protein [Telmatospirillum sp.]|uniref:LysR substrate-binding domain-containing protein n=1 Tax=Telmatospirillum sp. TaxID=2079197 RepID=UPI002845D68E|nr:LysR substrate-binding domain-containing protein [Telmatospirillum sp.]MDR3435282.1 LysR substrate-binding domain-containing protein [Telmatospirillum sp.]
MLTTDDLRFFAAVSAAASLAAAARTLDVSAPAVTQRLRALEARLGVQLIDRGGRYLTLTNEGELLAERGREIIASLGELTDAVSERRSVVSGHLRLVAPLGFGRHHIAPIVARFQAIHPKVRVDLQLTDRLGHTPAESWDIAIHVGPLDDATPGLTVRHLAPNERFLCCSPDYLARRGTPMVPEDLRAHACIALRENEEDVTLWRFRSKQSGDETRVRIEPDLASNAGEVVKAWALAGYGFIVRSEWDVAGDLLANRLVRVFGDYDLPAAPIVALVGTRREARAARTHRFLDELTERFSRPVWRQGANEPLRTRP